MRKKSGLGSNWSLYSSVEGANQLGNKTSFSKTMEYFLASAVNYQLIHKASYPWNYEIHKYAVRNFQIILLYKSAPSTVVFRLAAIREMWLWR